MTFEEFWPLYLRAHSLPGTRGLHYFASAIGAMSVTEAVISGQPFLLVGIAFGYAIAVGAHRFVEINRAIIRINAFWGIVADVRMCWLALTGRLRHEIARNIANGMPVDYTGGTNHSAQHLPITPIIRLMLLGVAAIGLVAGVLDLDDLFEAGTNLHYALIQLGVPILAFSGALVFGLAGMAKSLLILSYDRQVAISKAEESLCRASIALLAFGGPVLAMAELAEHGCSQSIMAIAFSILTSLISMTSALLIRRSNMRRVRYPTSAGLSTIATKISCTIGAVFCFVVSIGTLAYQVLHWTGTGRWQAFTMSAVFTKVFAVSNPESGLSTSDWARDTSVALVAFLTGAVFMVIALYASASVKRQSDDRLFQKYLDEARGSRETGPNN